MCHEINSKVARNEDIGVEMYNEQQGPIYFLFLNICKWLISKYFEETVWLLFCLVDTRLFGKRGCMLMYIIANCYWHRDDQYVERVMNLYQIYRFQIYFWDTAKLSSGWPTANYIFALLKHTHTNMLDNCTCHFRITNSLIFNPQCWIIPYVIN